MREVKLNKKGKRIFLSMSKSIPEFVDACTISLFIEKLKSTSLSARIKRKVMKNIKAEFPQMVENLRR